MTHHEAQLTFDGLWEAVAPRAEPKAPAELEPASEPLSGQADLFSGEHALRARAEAALLDLEPGAILRAAEEAARVHPRYEPARDWPAWAAAVRELAGSPEAGLAALEGSGLPGAGPVLTRRVLETARDRVAGAALEARGPAARLVDGRLAAALRRGSAVIDALRAAVSAGVNDAGTLTLLAGALWHDGRSEEALAAQRDALLADPLAVAEADIEVLPLLDVLDEIFDSDLPGDPRAWLPVVAHLRGLVHLPPRVAPAPEDAGVPRQVAALLAGFGALTDPRARIERKRAVVALAPALRPWLRAV